MLEKPLTTIPTQTPAEILAISPESLEIANTYLQLQNIAKVAETMNLPTDFVSAELSKREVRAYIDSVFQDLGYNNRFRMRQIMDALIDQKLSELEEAEIGSNKDIADLLALSHKMSIEYLNKQIELEKLRQSNVSSVTNVQVNEFGTDSKYGLLMQKLIEGTK